MKSFFISSLKPSMLIIAGLIYFFFGMDVFAQSADSIPKKKVEINKFSKRKNQEKEKNKTSTTSTITCPTCRHKKLETLHTDVCLLKYTCQKCKAILTPKSGDCCVFCSYGTYKCPSMQE